VLITATAAAPPLFARLLQHSPFLAAQQQWCALCSRPVSHPAGSLFRQFPKTSTGQSCVRTGYTGAAARSRDPETHLYSKSFSRCIFNLASDLAGNHFAETFQDWQRKDNVHVPSLVTQILKR